MNALDLFALAYLAGALAFGADALDLLSGDADHRAEGSKRNRKLIDGAREIRAITSPLGYAVWSLVLALFVALVWPVRALVVLSTWRSDRSDTSKGDRS